MAVDPSVEVHPEASVDDTAVIWAGTMVRESASIGAGTSIGRQSYVGPGVSIGANCKIQNHVLIYEPAIVEDSVFVGPGVVFTNDKFPRAVSPDGEKKSAADWEPVGVTVRRGASIGARATCVAPIEIGEWAIVAAGAVVVRDVAPFEIVGGVPARRLGWAGRSGRALVPGPDGGLIDEETGDRYREYGDGLKRESDDPRQ